MGAFVYAVHPQGRGALALVTFAAAAIYVLCIALFRALDAEDWAAVRSVMQRRFAG